MELYDKIVILCIKLSKTLGDKITHLNKRRIEKNWKK